MKKIFRKINEFFRTKNVSTSLAEVPDGSLVFRCNICGCKNIRLIVELGREKPSCSECGSTVRMRSIIYSLSTIFFDQSLTLADFPVRPEIRVVGLSDWIGYAIPLAHKVNYTNTFYHQEPKLDITSIQSDVYETVDVLISSDVFEHVSPPVSTAFENSFKLLKPGGALILTVPYTLEIETKEHFPNLHRYEILKQSGRSILVNVTRDGREERFDNLNFHGGDGATLEMRVFSQNGLLDELKMAGFEKIEIISKADFSHGIYADYRWSLPIIARKPE